MQLSLDFYMIEAKLGDLIGDRAYDSDKLDEELRQEGVEMIAPHRSNRGKGTTYRTVRISGSGAAILKRCPSTQSGGGE